MSENQDNEELNFNELIGNLLTSHNEAHEHNAMEGSATIDASGNMAKEGDQNPSDSNIDIDIHPHDHDVELPDIVDDDVGEEDFVSNVSDFTSVVSNAIDLIKPTTNSNIHEQEHETGNTVMEPLIDEEQQNEWAHLLQRGLYEEEQVQGQGDLHGDNHNKNEQSIGDTHFNNDALDQEDENLRRAILETLQVISNTAVDEDMPNGDVHNNNNNNNKNTLEGIKQVEILDKPAKKSLKKKKKDKDKQKQTSGNSKTTITESSEQEDKKKSKSKKKKKEKEKEKSKVAKNESKKYLQEDKFDNDDHLIKIDDVIRGIMGNDSLLESNNDFNVLNNAVNDFNESNEHGIRNDTNDFETQALVEATLKAFEKELMASETSSVPTTKTKKVSVTSKKTSSKSKAKSTAKKSVKSKVSTAQPSTSTTSKSATDSTATSKDLDYEIPISSFYPQPKKTTNTTTTTKKKKKKKTAKSSATGKELQNMIAESNDFEDDEFSKVLAEIVNQVVETSLAEPIEEKEKAKGKVEKTKRLSRYSIDSSSKSTQKDTSENKSSKDKKRVSQTKTVVQSPIDKATQSLDDDKEDYNDEPFDLNQIMQNAMSLAFQSKPREMEENDEESRLQDRIKKIQIEPSKLPDSEKTIEAKDKKIDGISKKSEEKETSSTDEVKINEGKQKKTKSKKVAKTKKSENVTKSETIKVKKPKEPKVKPKTSKKKISEPIERKKFETIIIDNFQKKLANNSMSDITSSMRKLSAQAKGKVDNKNREIVIRNVEIEKRFAKLKNGLVMKSQSPEEIFKKKFSLVAAAAANEARKRRRQKNKELRLKLKEEREKIRIAKKAQKELDQAKFDAEQKELAEIVARGPPYPPDLRLTKKGVPKKPYRRWTPEEMKLRAQLDNEPLDEVEPKVKVLKSNKNGIVTITKAPLFNFIRLNIVLEEKNLQDIKETLLKINLPESYLDYLFSNSGTLGYSIDEIVKALENRIIDKFDPSAKTIVHKERFLFHPPWTLPDYPPIALPLARRSIASRRHNKKKTSGSHDSSAFIAVTKKLIPTILNPIINTLKTAAKKRIANGASPEEATRHLLTIINHTKKSIAQVITNARNRQLRQSLTKVKLEDSVNKTALSAIKSSNLNMIPLLNTVSRNKRSLESTNVQSSDTNKQNILNIIPLVPLTKRVKRDENSVPEVIVISDHNSNTDNNNLSEAAVLTKPVKDTKTTGEPANAINKKNDIVEQDTATDSNVTIPVQKNSDEVSLKSINTDLETTASVSKVSDETSKISNEYRTPLPVISPVLQNSNNNNDNNHTNIETNTCEEMPNINDSKCDESVVIKKNNVQTIKESSKQPTILDKTDNVISELHHTAEVLPNEKICSLSGQEVTKNEELDVVIDKDSSLDTGDLIEKKSITVNSDNSDTNSVNTILTNYTSENSVHPVTESLEFETNGKTVKKYVMETHLKHSNCTSETVHIEAEKNVGSQQETANLIPSQDNEEGKKGRNFEETIPENGLNTKKNILHKIGKEREEEEKDIIEIKQENGSGLKKIPIDIPTISNETIAPNAPIKVESMVQSLVVQQLQNSNEADGESLPIGITSIITSTLTDLLPKIQQDFITEEKRQRRTGPNSVLNLDGLVPPSQVKMSPAERLLKNPIDRKIKPPKVKERKDTFQVKYNFNIPDFSNISGKKNILQKKLKEFLSSEEFELLRKDISKERKRRWRDANGIQNKINDLRARLRKRATKAFGVENTKEKLEWIDSTFKRKCEEAGFTEFLAQKANYSEKRDKATITDNDILNMLAINLNRLDLARKIEASLIEEAKVEVEPKRKKRKIDKVAEGLKEFDDSNIVHEPSESISNDAKLSRDTVINDTSRNSSVENTGNLENINDDLKNGSSNHPVSDTNIDTRLIAI